MRGTFTRSGQLFFVHPIPQVQDILRRIPASDLDGDLDAAREELLGPFANLVALVEDGLCACAGLGDEVLGVVMMPQELVALKAVQELGFGAADQNFTFSIAFFECSSRRCLSDPTPKLRIPDSVRSGGDVTQRKKRLTTRRNSLHSSAPRATPRRWKIYAMPPSRVTQPRNSI
jgi:hypothetical protein